MPKLVTRSMESGKFNSNNLDNNTLHISRNILKWTETFYSIFQGMRETGF